MSNLNPTIFTATLDLGLLNPKLLLPNGYNSCHPKPLQLRINQIDIRVIALTKHKKICILLLAYYYDYANPLHTQKQRAVLTYLLTSLLKCGKVTPQYQNISNALIHRDIV